jgi:hypothetical protein
MDANGASVSNPQLQGDAQANLHLQTSFGSTPNNVDLPYIAADLVMDWPLGTSAQPSDPNAPPASFGQSPTLAFNNVQFGFGSYLKAVLKPIGHYIKLIEAPLQPAIDVMNYSIPGLSDLSEKAGGGPISLDTLLEVLDSSHLLPANWQFIADLIVNLNDLGTFLSKVNFNEGVLKLGNYNIADGGGQDLRSLPDLGSTLNFDDKNLTHLVAAAQGAAADIQGQIDQLGGSAAGNTGNALSGDKLKALGNGGGFDFPLLDDPTQGVLKLLLGQDVDFVDFHYDYTQPGVVLQTPLAAGPISVSFEGGVNLTFHIQVGYDTYGLRQYLKAFVADPGTADPTLLLQGL